MHNPTNTAIAFVLLIAIVGAAFSYVSGNPVEIVEPWLGIKGTIITADLGLAQKEGYLIRCIEPDSPAENADLKVNDIIIEVDGNKVVSRDDIEGVLAQKQIGDSISFKIFRGAEQPTIEPLTFVDKPDTLKCPP